MGASIEDLFGFNCYGEGEEGACCLSVILLGLHGVAWCIKYIYLPACIEAFKRCRLFYTVSVQAFQSILHSGRLRGQNYGVYNNLESWVSRGMLGNLPTLPR